MTWPVLPCSLKPTANCNGNPPSPRYTKPEAPATTQCSTSATAPINAHPPAVVSQFECSLWASSGHTRHVGGAALSADWYRRSPLGSAPWWQDLTSVRSHSAAGAIGSSYCG